MSALQTNAPIYCGEGIAASGAFTVLQWSYIDTGTVTNFGRFAAKEVGTQGFQCNDQSTGSTGTYILIFRSTTNYFRRFSRQTTNAWVFNAFVWDTSSFATSLYRGSPTAAAASVSPISTTTGSGTYTDPTGDFTIGGRDNGGALLTVPFGPTAFFARELTLPEIISWQFNPMVNLPDCKGLWLPGDNGTASVPDWSGSGNNGTVSGATLRNGPSIARWRRGRHVWVPASGVAPPPAGGNGGGYYLRRRRYAYT